MKWLKKITGIQELINVQTQTNLYLSELVDLNEELIKEQKITNDKLNVIIMLEREKDKDPPESYIPRFKGDRP